MTPLLGFGGGDPVVDLRSAPPGEDPIGVWRRRAYAALLVALVGTGALAVLVDVVRPLVPTRYAFELEFAEDGTVTLTDVGDGLTAAGVPDSAVVVAIDGVVLDGESEVHTISEVRRIGRRVGRRPVELTVVGSEEGAAARTVVSELVPWRAVDIIGNLAVDGLLILIGWIGLLALGARSRNPSAVRFVELCLVGGVPLALFIAAFSLVPLAYPLAAEAGQFHWIGWMIPIWPFVFGPVLLRFLHVFPDPDPAAVAAERVPGVPSAVVLALAIAAAVGLGFAAVGTLTEGAVAEVALEFALLGSAAVAGLTALVFVPTWLVRMTARVLRVIRRRRREERRDPEEANRTRIAIFGIQGAVLCFAFILLFAGMSFVAGFVEGAFDTDLDLPDVADVAVAAALVGAVVLPYAGVGLAVVRRGLWDVDLLASRTALVTLLSLGFVVIWAVADELVEAMVPGGIAAAAPLIAGLAVAGAQGPLSGWLKRRFGVGGGDLPDAVARASERLGRGAEEPARLLGQTLADELGATPVAVLMPGPDASPTTAWATADWTGLPAARAGRLLAALESAPAVQARTDAGPFLAVRVGREGAVGAAVLLGPHDGTLYSKDDRKLISVMLGPTAYLFGATGEEM